MFLCLQTKKKDCDNFVITLFILYQKSYKRKFCAINSVIRITLHHKYGEKVENTNANHEQTWCCRGCSAITSVIKYLSKWSFKSKYVPSTLNPKLEELGSWNFERISIPHYVSCHLSPVTYPLSPVKNSFYLFLLKKKKKKKIL